MTKFLNWRVLVNAALFQILWFAAIMGSAKLLIWPSILGCLLLVVWQLHPKRKHAGDIKLVGVAIVLGLIIDTLLLQLNLYEFTYPFPFEGISPLWIILMWIGFALTVNHSMKWLELHPLLPALMGGIFAPLSYLAGLRLGAVEYLAGPLLISICISITWAIAMTILFRVAKNT